MGCKQLLLHVLYVGHAHPKLIKEAARAVILLQQVELQNKKSPIISKTAVRKCSAYKAIFQLHEYKLIQHIN